MQLKDNNKTDHFGGLGKLERNTLSRLSQLNPTVISAFLLEKEFRITRAQANLLLSRLSRKGWLQRKSSQRN